MTAQAINHPEIKMTVQAAILDHVGMSQLRYLTTIGLCKL